MTRKMLVTSALPYANGPIHIGHMVEYVQTDIWVRFQKMRGNEELKYGSDRSTTVRISSLFLQPMSIQIRSYRSEDAKKVLLFL